MTRPLPLPFGIPHTRCDLVDRVIRPSPVTTLHIGSSEHCLGVLGWTLLSDVSGVQKRGPTNSSDTHQAELIVICAANCPGPRA